MPLCRLVYFSANQLDLENGPLLVQLGQILETSIRNNRRAGVTGALVFDDLWFIQVLEGERQAVTQTMDRLRTDERHSQIVVAYMCDAEERMFGNWWMGLATRNESTLPAFGPYLQNGILQPAQMPGQKILSFVHDVVAMQAAQGVHAAE